MLDEAKWDSTQEFQSGPPYPPVDRHSMDKQVQSSSVAEARALSATHALLDPMLSANTKTVAELNVRSVCLIVEIPPRDGATGTNNIQWSQSPDVRLSEQVNGTTGVPVCNRLR